MGDDLLTEEVEEGSMTWAQLRARMSDMAEEIGEYHGIPMPLPGMNLTLYEGHPMRNEMWKFERERDGVPFEIHCGGGDVREDEFIRNTFYSKKAQAVIYMYQHGLGNEAKVFHAKQYKSHDHAMDRLTLALSTIGACDAWDLDAEYKAQEKLRSLLPEHNWRQYQLTGSFLEESPRSRLTYMFRRLRPTIAMSPRGRPGSMDAHMGCIAVLCMHPLGYYGRSWAGCMVPTDDVIAHLLFMRGDEARFWGQCNHHEPWRPEAGL
jgi:hypothetical protein